MPIVGKSFIYIGLNTPIGCIGLFLRKKNNGFTCSMEHARLWGDYEEPVALKHVNDMAEKLKEWAQGYDKELHG